MISPAKARANRRNALKSTGPKTAAGKAAVAANAHRHGLSIPVLLDPALSREADDLEHTRIAFARALELRTCPSSSRIG